jgi:hypothetical protein
VATVERDGGGGVGSEPPLFQRELRRISESPREPKEHERQGEPTSGQKDLEERLFADFARAPAHVDTLTR